DLLISEQHVASRFQIILFLDAVTGNGLTYLEALFGLDECHVGDDEDAWFAHAAQVVEDGVGCARAIAAAIERPGAAERAVPRTAAGKLNRGAGVEHSNE